MKRIDPQEDPLRFITNEQWSEMWVRLRLYTWKRYHWLHERLGENLDEVAHQAILDTMNGTRRWPPVDALTGEVKRGISLFTFLCEAVRSKVSHIWEREKKRISIDISDTVNDSEPFNQKSIDNLLNESAKRYPHLVRPDDTENKIIYNCITKKMLELVACDVEVFKIVKLWREEPDMKPNEIAATLGLSMPEVRAAQKRMRRLLKKFREGYNYE